MFMLVAHFRVPIAPGGIVPRVPIAPGGVVAGGEMQCDAIPADAIEPLAMLASSPDCGRLQFAHSTDSAERFVLVAEFASAAAYRRAISPWPMRMVVIPWLSTAELEHTEVNEVLYSAIDGEVVVWEPTVPEPGR